MVSTVPLVVTVLLAVFCNAVVANPVSSPTGGARVGGGGGGSSLTKVSGSDLNQTNMTSMDNNVNSSNQYCIDQDGIPPEQLALLKKAFEVFDPEKKGCISTEMVGTILRMLEHPVDDDILKEIIPEVDTDGSGEMEFEEFFSLASSFLNEEDSEAKLQELKEGNRYITTSAPREILKELDDKLTNDDQDRMIEEIDSDGSGTGDFDGSGLMELEEFHSLVGRVLTKGYSEAMLQ